MTSNMSFISSPQSTRMSDLCSQLMKQRRRANTTSIPVGPSDEDALLIAPHHHHPRPSIPLEEASQWTKTLRMASVFFFVGFVWHSTVLPWFYKQIGPEIASLIVLSGSHVDAFKDPPNLDPKILREFGFAGAASHTVVFMFGYVCATSLRMVRFGKIVRSETGRWEPIGIGVSLVLVVWTAAVFHVLAQAFCRYAFETKFGPVYSYAMLFYEEANGKTPFAWASSVSFTTALVLGFFMSGDVRKFEKMFLLQGNSFFGSASIVVPFAVWLGLLDNVLIPVSQKYFSTTFVDQDDIINGSHAFAFAVGLMMMFAGTATSLFRDSRCCNDKGKMTYEDDGHSNETYDTSNAFQVFQAATMTALVSSTLLGSALYKGDVALETMAKTMFRPALLSTGMAMAWFVVWLNKSRLTWTKVVDFVVNEHYPKRRAAFTYTLLLCLWQCHLVPFFACWIPFHLWAAVSHGFGEYTQLEALFDGFLYAFTGPYCGPVLVQGVVKFMSTRLKVPWGLVQESILAAVVLIPPTFTVWYRWRQGHVALPVHLFMSSMEVLYLLTWRNRPEYSGWRDWPELKRCRLWVLLQDYFSVRMIIDDQLDTRTFENGILEKYRDVGPRDHALRGYEPGKARIIGFHPHGMFPCTVVWQHLIPLWGRVFGSLVPYQLTDSFTHVPPGMREVQQWSGGREITKGVLNAMLGAGETVIVVPGGQSEMLMHNYENSRDKKVVMCAKHRGFIRIAKENRAELVPMISFGELQAIKNIKTPNIHRITRQIIGFPMPFIPVGIWDMLPLPKSIPFTLVYGQPIKLFHEDPNDKVYSEDDIDEGWKTYFTQVFNLFEKHKHQAGYGDLKLILVGFNDKPGTVAWKE